MKVNFECICILSEIEIEKFALLTCIIFVCVQMRVSEMFTQQTTLENNFCCWSQKQDYSSTVLIKTIGALKYKALMLLHAEKIQVI